MQAAAWRNAQKNALQYYLHASWWCQHAQISKAELANIPLHMLNYSKFTVSALPKAA